MNYYVKATVRDKDCDKNAAINSLVLNEKYNGFTVHSNKDLRDLANMNLLWSKCDRTGNVAKVRIFWSDYYNRWIATTRADSTTCDNLLSKPIYRATSKNGTTTVFDSCPL